MNSRHRVMIVDDSSAYRRVIRHCLERTSNIEVVAEAANGQLAMPLMREFAPGIVILDQEMPVMNGLETLKSIRHRYPQIGVIMFSSHTVEGAQVTLKALEMGALDFVAKPVGTDPVDYINQQLVPLIQALQVSETTVDLSMASAPARPDQAAIVGIGVSTGGPVALRELLGNLPGDLSTPILIVQHMPPLFTRQLADTLSGICSLPVFEAQDGQAIGPGVYIAPGGRHMEVRERERGVQIHIHDGDPELHCRPSVNILFRSLARVYGASAVGIIMTGMGEDGYAGIRELYRANARVYAQSPESCLIFGMPSRPVREGLVQGIGDIPRLATWIAGTGRRAVPKLENQKPCTL